MDGGGRSQVSKQFVLLSIATRYRFNHRSWFRFNPENQNVWMRQTLAALAPDPRQTEMTKVAWLQNQKERRWKLPIRPFPPHASHQFFCKQMVFCNKNPNFSNLFDGLVTPAAIAKNCIRWGRNFSGCRQDAWEAFIKT